MDVEIELGKSLEENASAYFEKSKQAKRKLSGLKKAMLAMDKKVSKASKKPKYESLSKKRKRQWFEAFHWFRSTDNFLVIGGRSAKDNEIVVKKHLEKGDLFLHADIQGGSACVIKSEGKEIPSSSLGEAAQFAAVWSKAWQQGLAAVDVYAVSKDQVSKSAKPGEALGTGSFMIYGKRQWFRKTPLVFAIGLVKEGRVFAAMSGPPNAVKRHSLASFGIGLGSEKKASLAKAILKGFGDKLGKKNPVSLDEIISVLPGERLSIREQF